MTAATIERRRAYQRIYKAKHRDRLNAQTREYRAKNRTKWRKLDAAWRKANPHKVREHHRKAVYGLAAGEFDKLLKKQKKRCAICRARLAPAHIDHNHDTGKVRGLLCKGCNTGIGLLKEKPAILRKALAYLEKDDV